MVACTCEGNAAFLEKPHHVLEGCLCSEPFQDCQLLLNTTFGCCLRVSVGKLGQSHCAVEGCLCQCPSLFQQEHQFCRFGHFSIGLLDSFGQQCMVSILSTPPSILDFDWLLMWSSPRRELQFCRIRRILRNFCEGHQCNVSRQSTMQLTDVQMAAF